MYSNCIPFSNRKQHCEHENSALHASGISGGKGWVLRRKRELCLKQSHDGPLDDGRVSAARRDDARVVVQERDGRHGATVSRVGVIVRLECNRKRDHRYRKEWEGPVFTFG